MSKEQLIVGLDIGSQTIKILGVVKDRCSDLYRVQFFEQIPALGFSRGRIRDEKLLTKKIIELTEKVREKYGVNEKIQTLHAEAEKLPLKNCSVKLVLCNGVYPHFSDKLVALREFHRVLKNGGLLIINHFMGREQINMIHSHLEAEILRSDLLETAAELGDKCRKVGFSLIEESDRADLFRIKAVKI